MKQEKLTLEKIAAHFDVNKSTVSRALSGKGTMSRELRKQIVHYAKANGYQGTRKKRTAESKNIAVILPRNLLSDSLFFQHCMMGVVETASESNYDVVITLEEDNGTAAIRRLAERRKCDGYVLLQTYNEDRQIRYLNGIRAHYVVAGTMDEDCYQVDADNMHSVRELTGHLIKKGCRRIGFIGGMQTFQVNQRRRQGFLMAFDDLVQQADRDLIFSNVQTNEQVDEAVRALLSYGCDCIVCGDDILTQKVMARLTLEGVSVPGQVQLASCYDSALLLQATPSVTAVSMDPREMGRMLGKRLMELIQGKKTEKHTAISFRIQYRESTEGHMT